MYVRLALALSITLASPSLASAQGSLASTLSGRILGPDGGALPEAAVTVTSPQLQGQREVTGTANGEYVFAFLPPGDYEVSAAATGFHPALYRVKLAAAQEMHLDLTLQLAASEKVDVSAVRDVISRQPGVATTFTAETVEALPVGRGYQAIATLAPTVTVAGPGGRLALGGAPASEGLYLIDGVVVNENRRRQGLDLYVEDGVQETTVGVSGLSAEYGRFLGGVVSVLTRVGGNSLSGSFRTSFANDSWSARTPFSEPHVHDLQPTYEATLGAPVLKDRLWFFGAARLQDVSTVQLTAVTAIPYVFESSERRYQAKLTFSPSVRHTLRASFTDVDSEERNTNNPPNFRVMDLGSLAHRRFPQTLLVIDYTGVLAPRLTVQAFYARRDFSVVDVGPPLESPTQGVFMTDAQRGTAYNAPQFLCPAGCDDERDNRNFVVKGSWFSSAGRLGSHRVVVGLDEFDDRTVLNLRGNRFSVAGTTTVVRGQEIFPAFLPGSTTFNFSEPTTSTEGSNYRVHAAFANDTWRLGSGLALNLGLRWDKNHGRNNDGVLVSSGAALSPRLSLSYDPRGDGRLELHAGYARYVSSVPPLLVNQASSSGTPLSRTWQYQGPPINGDASAAELLAPDQALAALLGWFFANGGFDRPVLAAFLPGFAVRVVEPIKPTRAEELFAGTSLRAGRWGTVRVDLVHKRFFDFFRHRLDLGTGRTEPRFGQVFDLAIMDNSPEAARRYLGLLLQLGLKPTPRLELGGHWVLSRTRGNFDGEDASGGAVAADRFNQYPEYKDLRWHNPSGWLNTDQRHNLRAWAVVELPVPQWLGTLSASALQMLATGSPYSAVGSVDTRPFVSNPGYRTPPANVSYFFSPRGAFRTDTVHRTDISLNWGRHVGRHLVAFAQPELLNIFNLHAVTRVGSSVLTAANATGLARFNPFTQVPALGSRGTAGANWDFGPGFGQPLVPGDYQLPRTFRISLGARF